jgi:hypothetical protein
MKYQNKSPKSEAMKGKDKDADDKKPKKSGKKKGNPFAAALKANK